MKKFTHLYSSLDETTKTSEKTKALVEYFNKAHAQDAAWAVYFLSGRKPKRLVKTSLLRQWAAEVAELADWLFEECYDSVGDLAETIALVLPDNNQSCQISLSQVVDELLLPLQSMEDNERKELVLSAWSSMNPKERFIYNKLLTGAFRVGVSQRLVTRSLAIVSGIDANVIAHRLMGNWEPTEEFFASLISSETQDSDKSKPYPFFLAHPLEASAKELGAPEDWSAEWKWDGIRAQLIKREGETFIWSRGEELITDQYPELKEASQDLPNGTVLDGEILCWKDDSVLSFAQLQRRLGRKKVGPKLLKEAPVILMAYDLLEHGQEDFRSVEFQKRQLKLEEIVTSLNSKSILKSPIVQFDTWEQLAQDRETSRARSVEGLMLKRQISPYRVGRQRGDWWKWKVEPYLVDAVLLYAQRGHGKRASLYSDYTFAVWDGDTLIPFAKAYSGLTDEEIRKVDAFVKKNTKERFGPVRSVKPELVFELAFEGIQESTRHKSGIAVRFPRMNRWRLDKKIEEADSLETVKALISIDSANSSK